MTDEELDKKVDGWLKQLEAIECEITDITDRHGLLMDANADKMIIAFATEIDDIREQRGQGRIYTGMYSICNTTGNVFRKVMNR